MDIEDAFDAQTVISKQTSVAGSAHQPPASPQTPSQYPQPSGSSIASSMSRLSLTPDTSSIASSEFQSDLESSRVYRRAQRGTLDASSRNSIIGAGSFTGSVFSGLSLGDISIMSVIAIPVYAKDLSNPQHYDFGNDEPPQEEAPRQLSASQGTNETSIYHDCLELKLLLMHTDELRPLFEADRAARGIDPMNELLEVFRLGYPLLILFNKIQYRWSVDVFKRKDRNDYAKQATAEFIQACRNELGLGGGSMFTVTELMSGDIFQFSKVNSISVPIYSESLLTIGKHRSSAF